MFQFKVTFESTMKSEKTTYFTTHRNPCVSDPIQYQDVELVIIEKQNSE